MLTSSRFTGIPVFGVKSFSISRFNICAWSRPQPIKRLVVRRHLRKRRPPLCSREYRGCKCSYFMTHPLTERS